jgi:hypothetical protein
MYFFGKRLTSYHHSICWFFLYPSISPGIFSPPELADGFRRIVQPIAIREQSDQLTPINKGF